MSLANQDQGNHNLGLNLEVESGGSTFNQSVLPSVSVDQLLETSGNSAVQVEPFALPLPSATANAPTKAILNWLHSKWIFFNFY